MRRRPPARPPGPAWHTLRRRVPVRFQASRAECGVACLAMVLSFHGCPTSVREAREMCAMGRDGLSAGALARAARRLGMTATGLVADPAKLAGTRLPAIAHWEGNHFVVVERIGRHRVRLVDPQFGRRRLSRDEFRAGLGRVLVEVWPGEQFQRSRAAQEPFWRSYLRSLLSLKGTRPLLAQLVLASLVLQALGLIVPLIVSIAADGTGAAYHHSLLGLIGIGIVLAATAQLVTTYLRSALVLYLQGRLDTHAMIGFCSHLLRLPLRYFQQRSTGDVLMRIGSIAVLRDMLTTQTLSSVLDAGMLVSYLAILLAVDVISGLAVLAVAVAEILLLAVTVPWIRERMAADLAAQAEAQGHIVEALEGITTLKASATEGRALDRWSELFLIWMKATLRRSHAAAVIDAAAGTMRALTPLLVLWLGTARVLDGKMNAGTLLAVTWIASAAVAPLSTLISGGQRLQLAGAELQRLADVLENEPEYPPDRPAVQQVGLGRIEFCDVSFGYDPYTPLALDDVSFQVEPGQRVAIVGATGAGKSTLGMLLLGLYLPTQGVILAGGVPLAEFDPRTLRGQVGAVLQEPFVFSGTIRDNITFRDPQITSNDVERAARLAELHAEIAALPMKYETQLSERGGGLSGGQRQRLAIARALVRSPALLLLDEATSHLDAVTEGRIHHNLQMVGCTQIIIAHRLSTVRDADLILVLDHGRLTERGTHDDLLAADGHYAALIAAQVSPTADLTG
jgi:ATP-binding cassette, subfamily B, bacterial